jgi:hypothetical protein
MKVNTSASGMLRGIIFVLAGTLALAANAQETPSTHAPQWIPALSYGGAPECPKHLGSRVYRSDIARDSHITAFIVGKSVHKAGGCQATAEIQVIQSGKTRHFALTGPGEKAFSLVDFSPDGTRALLAHNQRADDFHQYRETSVALMPLVSGKIEWRNTWDIFGWKDCDATVEPQGFLPDGKVVIRARKAVTHFRGRADCVNESGLYVTDLSNNSAVRLPDSTKVARYGKHERPGFQACKSDPDIVDACFKVHGRLSAWNGPHTMRIWRIGTSRILGVQDDIMPEDLTSKMDLDVEAYGDFEVRPFTRERSAEMRMVCIEKAENVVIKKR